MKMIADFGMQNDLKWEVGMRKSEMHYPCKLKAHSLFINIVL